MSKTVSYLPFSPRAALIAANATLIVMYLALIAFVMSYAALTVEFSQSVRNDEASVGVLEGQYLAQVSAVTDTNPAALGYAKPVAEVFVPALPQAAISVR